MWVGVTTIFGRESPASQQRAERFRQWVAVRSFYAPISVLLGILSLVDLVVVVLGLMLGIAAVVTGLLGLADINRRPHLLGGRLCGLSIVLGATGVTLSVVLWQFVYPLLAANR